MAMKDYSILDDDTLSEQLQEHLSQSPENKDAYHTSLLLNELHIHQIELEMQNRELKESQRELEEARDKYADLYDFAPIGYASFDVKGCIREINLTACHMLGMSRANIQNKPFSIFLSADDIKSFFNHIREVFETLQKSRIELMVKPIKGRAFPVRIESSAHRNPYAEIICQTAIIDINESKKIEQQLKWERDVSSSLIDTAQSIIISLDSQGNILKSNRYFDNLTGFAKQEIAGKNLVEHLITPSDRTVAQEKMKMAIDGNPGSGFTSSILTRNGPEKTIEWRCSAVMDEANNVEDMVLAIGHDVTERVAAENTLAEHELLLRQLIDAIPALVGYLNTSLRYVYCNNAHEQWLSVEKQNIAGSYVEQVFGQVAYKIMAPLLDKSLQGENVSSSLEMPIAGQTRNVLMNIIPDISSDNSVQGVFIVINDISELKQEQNQLLQRLTAISHESRLMMIGQMTSEIAHEINQPLTAISSYSSAGIVMHDQGGLDNKTSIDIFRKIGQQVERINGIITHLRRLSQRREAHFEKLEINQLILDILQLVKAEQHWFGINVDTQLSDSQLFVYGDAVLLEQAILNILRNALESVTGAELKNPRVVIKTILKDNQVKISVSDNGPGINKELIPKLFTPFISSKEGGLGLGLAITKSIVDAHHGKISLETVNNNTNSSITLPEYKTANC
jgi:PAS domain S-box-containing protein